jgi:hypothetical protein
LHQGFGTGLYLGYHGADNRILKTKLASAYLQYCPQLSSGIFMSTEQILLSSALALGHTQRSFFEDADYALPAPQQPEATARAPETGEADTAQPGPFGPAVVNGDHRVPAQQQELDLSAGEGSDAVSAEGTDEASGGNGDGDTIVSAAETFTLPPLPATATGAVSSSFSATSPKHARAGPRRPVGEPIRVGLLSRYLHSHPVGFLCQGLVAMLPRPKFRVLVFKVGAPVACATLKTGLKDTIMPSQLPQRATS